MLLIELPQTAQTAPIQLNRWQQKKKKKVCVCVGGVLKATDHFVISYISHSQTKLTHDPPLCRQRH